MRHPEEKLNCDGWESLTTQIKDVWNTENTYTCSLSTGKRNGSARKIVGMNMTFCCKI
jgi:hypothetical protein